MNETFEDEFNNNEHETAMYKLNYFVFVILLLLVCPVVPKRSSVGGGGFSRGNSAARGGVASGGFNGWFLGSYIVSAVRYCRIFLCLNISAGGRPSSGFSNQGGFNQGGFHPNNQGGFHGNPSGGFHSPPGQGLVMVILKTKLCVKVLLHILSGILAYEAGKAIIQSATTPFNYGGRNYYWDNNYQGRNGEIQCSMPLSQLQQKYVTLVQYLEN
uniref:CX domain-containing protein n=1 Tax=Heterorhabditis bacteriophora TaxID=37862 RepID=A0A1I7X8V3_HETBA